MAKSRYPEIDDEVARSRYYDRSKKPLTGKALSDTRGQDRENLQDLEEDQRYGDRQMQPATKPLGSYKKGGTVPKTGTYKLHKGEKVVPVKKSAATRSPSKPASRPSARRR